MLLRNLDTYLPNYKTTHEERPPSYINMFISNNTEWSPRCAFLLFHAKVQLPATDNAYIFGRRRSWVRLSDRLERNLILLQRSQDNEAINVFHSRFKQLVDSCYFVRERKKQEGFVCTATKAYCYNVPQKASDWYFLYSICIVLTEADVKWVM
jgi:hypothetical protein